MKKLLPGCLLWFIFFNAYAQPANSDIKFSAIQLKADLAYLKTQLLNAHAYPYSELSKSEYEKVFDDIDARLTDSATATAFYKMIKPVTAYLSDEHAQINLNRDLQSATYQNGSIFLPFSLSEKGNAYAADQILTDNSGLKQGDIITHVNGVPVAELVSKCALYTTGFPDQRMQKALDQFGYLYTWATAQPTDVFNLKTTGGNIITIKGINAAIWQDFVSKSAWQEVPRNQMITYNRYKNTGYINARSFSTHNDAEFDSLKNVIAGIFKQVKADGVTTLFVDVSKNGGGNSSVGDVLIDYFYDKPYKSYQCNWKRSDEYLSKMKSWGIKDENYAGKVVGSTLHFDSEKIKPSAQNPDRFNGKVYVLIGDGTFSSAIMFATTIKDNHIAQLAGTIPANGHPDHFGELYDTKLPNTRIAVRFGVKEWIRPAGKVKDNVLRPDIAIDLTKFHTNEEIINSVVNAK